LFDTPDLEIGKSKTLIGFDEGLECRKQDSGLGRYSPYGWEREGMIGDGDEGWRA